MTGPRTVAEALQPIEGALNGGDLARRRLSARPGLVPAVYPIVEARAAEVLAAQLDIGIAATLITAWSTYRALLDAGRRTRATPGTPEDVVLAEHSVSSEHHPTVEVLIDGQPVAAWTFDVALTLVVRAAVAVVDAGSVVAVRVGELEVAATLALEGVQLGGVRRSVTRGYPIDLGSGVPLGNPAPAPSATPWWQRV